MTAGTALIQELIDDPRLVYRHTVEDYHRMIEGGTLAEGMAVELLDGQIVRKVRSEGGQNPMGIGVAHASAVTRMGLLGPRFSRAGCLLRVQQPLTLPEFDEPEPDGAIVRGDVETYVRNHPAARDVLCVIEVSDDSLRRDRGYKQRLYADSGIPLYLIFNLPDQVVERHSIPLKGKGRYGTAETLDIGKSIAFPTAAGKDIVVRIRQLLG